MTECARRGARRYPRVPIPLIFVERHRAEEISLSRSTVLHGSIHSSSLHILGFRTRFAEIITLRTFLHLSSIHEQLEWHRAKASSFKDANDERELHYPRVSRGRVIHSQR